MSTSAIWCLLRQRLVHLKQLDNVMSKIGPNVKLISPTVKYFDLTLSSPKASLCVTSQIPNTRNFNAGIVRLSISKEKEERDKSLQEKEPIQEEDIFHPTASAPTWFDKKVLVWMGRYASEEAIPVLVPANVINRSKDKFRIYVNLGLIALGFSLWILARYTGMKKKEKGETLVNTAMEKYNFKTPSNADTNLPPKEK